MRTFVCEMSIWILFFFSIIFGHLLPLFDSDSGEKQELWGQRVREWRNDDAANGSAIKPGTY